MCFASAFPFPTLNNVSEDEILYCPQANSPLFCVDTLFPNAKDAYACVPVLATAPNAKECSPAASDLVPPANEFIFVALDSFPPAWDRAYRGAAETRR